MNRRGFESLAEHIVQLTVTVVQNLAVREDFHDEPGFPSTIIWICLGITVKGVKMVYQASIPTKSNLVTVSLRDGGLDQMTFNIQLLARRRWDRFSSASMAVHARDKTRVQLADIS